MSFFLRFALVRNWYINRVFNEREALRELRERTENEDLKAQLDAEIAVSDVVIYNLMVM